MLVYSRERFIGAHEDIRVAYKNHSYDRYVRDAICNSCGSVINEQVKYANWTKEFVFADKDVKGWRYCPFCGERLY